VRISDALLVNSGLNASDFHYDEDEATIRLHEKGNKGRTIGLHYATARANGEYLEQAAMESVPYSASTQRQKREGRPWPHQCEMTPYLSRMPESG
jgi:hypothetical protein